MFNRLLTENDIKVFSEIIEKEKYAENGFKHRELICILLLSLLKNNKRLLKHV